MLARILFVLLLLLVPLPADAAHCTGGGGGVYGYDWYDVPYDAWYRPHIMQVSSNELQWMSGWFYEDGIQKGPYFRPDADIHSGDWANALERAFSYSTGCGTGTVLRADAAVDIVRAVGLEAAALTMPEADVAAALARYADADEIASYARRYVAAATRYGIMEGETAPDGSYRFAPARPLTRAEAAVVLARSGLARADVVTADGRLNPARVHVNERVTIRGIPVAAGTVDGEHIAVYLDDGRPWQEHTSWQYWYGGRETPVEPGYRFAQWSLSAGQIHPETRVIAVYCYRNTFNLTATWWCSAPQPFTVYNTPPRVTVISYTSGPRPRFVVRVDDPDGDYVKNPPAIYVGQTPEVPPPEFPYPPASNAPNGVYYVNGDDVPSGTVMEVQWPDRYYASELTTGTWYVRFSGIDGWWHWGPWTDPIVITVGGDGSGGGGGGGGGDSMLSVTAAPNPVRRYGLLTVDVAIGAPAASVRWVWVTFNGRGIHRQPELTASGDTWSQWRGTHVPVEPDGVYDVTVTADVGGVVHTATISVTVSGEVLPYVRPSIIGNVRGR